MTDDAKRDCPHGRLARQCNECELEGIVGELRIALKAMRCVFHPIERTKIQSNRTWPENDSLAIAMCDQAIKDSNFSGTSRLTTLADKTADAFDSQSVHQRNRREKMNKHTPAKARLLAAAPDLLAALKVARTYMNSKGEQSRLDVAQVDTALAMAPRFANVSCSQCGNDFGPGDHGYSHCLDHQIISQEFIVTLGFDAMRVCLGMQPLHHDAARISEFILTRAAA